MTIVGYDDNKHGGAVEVMNSWGRAWGNDGFVWITYDDLDLFGHTAFYMDLGYKYYTSSGCQLGECADGYGRYKWETGEIYEGELSSGYFDGQGIYMWGSSEGFAGDWKDGNKHGKGVQLYSDGSTLTGYWKDNTYYGETAPYYAETEEEETTTEVITPEKEEEEEEEEIDINWESIFSEIDEEEVEDPTTGCISGDCENGFGKFIYSDGDIYEGNFKSSYRHGQGKYVYIEGDIYDGIWVWSDRQGLGYYQWPSGNEYIGYWSSNQQEGKGTKFYLDGTTEAGTWKAGVFQTTGTFGFTASEGEKIQTKHNAGTYFKPVESGKDLKIRHNQIPMKQGLGGIPRSGLGTPMEDPYHKTADKVLKNILKGIGKTDLANPRLNIMNSDRDVAYTNRSTGIHVSTKFIDLCRTFGKDSLSALSIVLAHELGHYYKDHFFCRDFGYAYAETEWANEMTESFDEIHKTGYFETQADEFGLFYSFISGYNPFDVAEDLIAAVYENFNLPDEMTGYPPKKFRIDQVNLAAENVRKLIPLFEVGNYMTVLGTANGEGLNKFLLEDASLCYEHILDQKIKTPEMYNNLGVVYINRAFCLMSKKDIKYAYPLELDFNSRLKTMSNSKGWEADHEKLIAQAKSFFSEAIQLDEAYVPSYNNLSIASILTEFIKQDKAEIKDLKYYLDFDEAWVNARKAKKLAKASESDIEYRNSVDLLALIAWESDEKDDAREIWEEAKSLKSPFVDFNIKAAKASGQTVSNNSIGGAKSGNLEDLMIDKRYEKPKFGEVEKIDGETLFDIGSEYLYQEKIKNTWNLKDKTAIAGKIDHKGDDLFVFAGKRRSSVDDYYFFYFVDADSEKSTSLKINNGKSAKELATTYGEPLSVISSGSHDYWVYLSKNIIFKINQEDKVDGWVIYDINL